MTFPLLDVRALAKSYPTKRNFWGKVVQRTTAVAEATFTISSGTTFALVGESGAGKSTIGRLIVGLVRPDAGEVFFEGENIIGSSHFEFRRLRSSMQMIFQDPYSSLDPRIPIIDAVAEPLVVHTGLSRRERRRQALELFERVGLGEQLAFCMPSELSGGQLQRVSIARALTVKPKLIVCDEPVAALDVSIRAQIINLMIELQEDFGLSYLFISHDLALVRTIADTVAVMQGGRIVEQGDVIELFENPRHPYTVQLLESIPKIDLRVTEVN
jgi:oligopeptide transport system ATP-binding protein